MSIRQLQSSFGAGEISETAFGRIDLDTYYKSAQKIRNCYVSNQGYLFRREGTEYIASTTNNAAARLISFEFNNIQSYLLVFTAGEFKVYKDGALQATISSSPISGLTAAQIQEMDFTQSADTLILVHPDQQPIRITRTSDTNWTAALLTLSNIPVFPFSGVSESNPASTLTPAAVNGKDVVFTLGSSVAASSWEGQFILADNGGTVFVTEQTSGTEIRGNIIVDFPNTNAIASGKWALETGYEDVWSSTRGWPVSLTFYQNRLYFGGSKSRPQTIWGSKVGDFFNFDLGEGLDDEAIDYTIDDNEVNAIKYLMPGQSLSAFTTGGEHFTPIRVDQAVTPSTFKMQKSTVHGIEDIKPVSVDGSIVFVEREGASVRNFIYNEIEQTFNAGNISVLSEHLLRGPSRMAVRQAIPTAPADYVYIVNDDDGSMAVINTLREQNLLAWSLFETEGEFEDVATVDRDTYVLVKRSLPSGDVRYIERLNGEHFMDASRRETVTTATTSWTTFDHLEGLTVKVRGDDFILEDQEISNGEFTTEQAVKNIEAGINFSALVQTNPIQLLNAQLASPQNRERFISVGDYNRLVFTLIRLYNSRNVIVKTETKTYRPKFREFGSNVFDSPVPLFTGWKKVYLQGSARDNTITITQEEPLEFQVLAAVIGVR